MKIAILYSGRIENYHTYYNNVKKYIVQNNDVDFFLSHSKELNEDLTGFIELYKPKIVIEESVYFNGQTQHYNGVCMFINRHRIFTAFKKYCSDNNIVYDFIMVYRIDLMTLQKINFEEFIKNDDNLLYIPNLNHSGGINDFLAIGNMTSIEKYCNLILYYNIIYDNIYRKDSNESILLFYINNIIKCKIIIFPFSVILRDTLWNNGGENIRMDVTPL